jgi:antitoxin (DNA-binding transcriptional repressor) of toxin-antitoxin stability system
VKQTQIVTATWARRHVFEILNRVAAGETVIVTRYGKPVAQIVLDEQPAPSSEANGSSHIKGSEADS